MRPDRKTVEAAREKMRGLLNRMSFAERWRPVALELMRVVIGKSDQAIHNTPLPDYCYPILELVRRTIFKGLSNPSEIIRPATGNDVGKVDWESMGLAVGIGLRGIQFLEHQLEAIEELHLEKMSAGEAEELGNMLVSDKFIADRAKEFGLEPSLTALERQGESELRKLEQTIRRGEPKLDKRAFEAGPETLQAFKIGIGKGIGAFLTSEGDFRGEKRLKLVDTYWMLLLTWPEVGEMLRAQPPKRMEDLWDWISPFSHAGWIEIQDLDQLVSLCRPIGLKLKKPGAPRGPRKKC
jgi:hypothetical protein